ncbi:MULTISPECIES: GNAT family N-acetyltransferase [Mumia]|uniref:GNAT family N-acetyltransferase n=1 Tax=Mumia TaxID=1546255 RepID=UPI0014205690|nr:MULTISPECIES: GNAT family N-acetyltransferase [unclassified Mumia]QMW66135.1 GNAT family N-acetyltransferase [Mumia sp. ZJ1417]
MLVRRMEDSDLDAVLALNQSAIDGVGALTADRLREIVGYADQSVVSTDADGVLTGFALTLPPGTPYDSINYQWYKDEYDAQDYAYLDRVVVAPDFRRRGVGTLLYNVLEERARARELVALEVYVDPPNEPSLAFHRARGYTEVGRLDHPNGKKVAMLVKRVG